MNTTTLPDEIRSEEELEELLTRPTDALIQAIRGVESPLVILGAGGKMGPSLAVLAARAAECAGHPLKIVAASRFTNDSARQLLEARGIRTVSVDILDRSQLKQLPDTTNVLYLVGLKFGSSTNPVPTWITNTLGPITAAQRFAGARFVALSTGNVYPFTPTDSGGSRESDRLDPVGEYACAAVARERMFEYFADKDQTPCTLVRLNYAHDLRYGVISDLAQRIIMERPIDVTMGHFNAIWQGDANDVILRCFELCSVPPSRLNLTSSETFSVRDVAGQLSELMGKSVRFVGGESECALLSNASQCVKQFGQPATPVSKLIQWIAAWTLRGGKTLGKPTGFESRDGRF